MGILSFFARRRNARLVAQRAEEVAGRSGAAVLDRVRRRATSMRLAEARGYVRSRALEIVHREMAAVQSGLPKLDTALQTEIISRATEAVVTYVMAEIRNVPNIGRPARRKAA